jgi:hypothetical protein
MSMVRFALGCILEYCLWGKRNSEQGQDVLVPGDLCGVGLGDASFAACRKAS